MQLERDMVNRALVEAQRARKDESGDGGSQEAIRIPSPVRSDDEEEQEFVLPPGGLGYDCP